jgi:membrane-bound ClpP family serine protease
MQRIIFALIIIAAFSTSLIARAATLTTSAARDGNVVTFDGEITEGDADTLKGIIQRANNAGHLVAIVRLTSWW